MEKRLRAACFYQEKEDKTSVDSGPYVDTRARKNFSLRSSYAEPSYWSANI